MVNLENIYFFTEKTAFILKVVENKRCLLFILVCVFEPLLYIMKIISIYRYIDGFMLTRKTKIEAFLYQHPRSSENQLFEFYLQFYTDERYIFLYLIVSNSIFGYRGRKGSHDFNSRGLTL